MNFRMSRRRKIASYRPRLSTSVKAWRSGESAGIKKKIYHGRTRLRHVRPRDESRSGSGGFFCRFQRGFEVGLLGDFLDVFDVGDGVVLIDDENASREQMQFLDQRAVAGAETRAAPVAERGDLVHAGRAAPS